MWHFSTFRRNTPSKVGNYSEYYRGMYVQYFAAMCISPKIFINYKWENSDFIVEKLSRHLLNQVIKFKITSNKSYQCVAHHFCGILAKNLQPQSNHGKIDTPKFHQIYLLYHFSSCECIYSNKF